MRSSGISTPDVETTPDRKINRSSVRTKLVVAHRTARPTSQPADATSPVRASVPAPVRNVVPPSVQTRTPMPMAMATTTATVGLARNTQCGCRSTATTLSGRSSFLGYGITVNGTAHRRGTTGTGRSPYDVRVDDAELLADLDPDQRAAVSTDAGLVAVIAGAGSGKTRVLTRRIAHRLAIGTADPQHTLALTFTREAAGELRRRLRRLGHRDTVEA